MQSNDATTCELFLELSAQELLAEPTPAAIEIEDISSVEPLFRDATPANTECRRIVDSSKTLELELTAEQMLGP